MKKLFGAFIMFSWLFGSQQAVASDGTDDHVLNHTVRALAGDEEVNLADAYQGQVVLIVNTASKCGFTGQYDGLEAMHAKYKDQGFAVLGFPSGDFANQEYREEAKIQEFCRLTYGVQFPMFEKSNVYGASASPVWASLIKASGTSPKWNFYKYLVGRDGRVIDVFSSVTSPESASIIKAVEQAIAEPQPNA